MSFLFISLNLAATCPRIESTRAHLCQQGYIIKLITERAAVVAVSIIAITFIPYCLSDAEIRTSDKETCGSIIIIVAVNFKNIRRLCIIRLTS